MKQKDRKWTYMTHPNNLLLQICVRAFMRTREEEMQLLNKKVPAQLQKSVWEF